VDQAIKFWNLLIQELKTWTNFLDNCNIPALEFSKA